MKTSKLLQENLFILVKFYFSKFSRVCNDFILIFVP